MKYLEKEDILHITISEEAEITSAEINPNVTAEFNKKGEIIGVEIIDASSFIRDMILESEGAKLLNLSEFEAPAKLSNNNNHRHP